MTNVLLPSELNIEPRYTGNRHSTRTIKTKKINLPQKEGAKKITSDSLLPTLSKFKSQAHYSDHNDLHAQESSIFENKFGSRYTHPTKPFQLNIFDTTPFHKRKNHLLDNTRQKLVSQLPVQPSHLIPNEPQSHSNIINPSVSELIDEHATVPIEHFEAQVKNNIPCPCKNNKCELRCECAEPYKQALWNFVQCMQGCIESVLTEIDKIRSGNQLMQDNVDIHGAGYKRSTRTSYTNLKKLKNIIEEYKSKLNELELVSKSGYSNEIHPTYIEDKAREKLDDSTILLKSHYPKGTVSRFISSSNEDIEENIGVDSKSFQFLLKEMLKYFEDLDDYGSYEDSNSAEFDYSSDEFEDEDSTSVEKVFLPEIDSLRPCSFESFLKIAFDKLLKKEITLGQLRQLCLADIKKCINSKYAT